MATWVDVECLMAYWYREGDHNVWADWAELGQELEALAVHPQVEGPAAQGFDTVRGDVSKKFP